jgi:hypothetical protein
MIKGKIGAKMGSRDISSSTNGPDYLNSQVKGRVCVCLSLPPTCTEKKKIQLKDTSNCANKKLLRRVVETRDPANSSNFLHLLFFLICP